MSSAFKVEWVNKANLAITYNCKVPIQIASHKDEILRDVLPMNVIHILLGRPWFYNLNALHHDRDKTYTFRYHDKDITLTPCKPRELLSSSNPKPSLTSNSHTVCSPL